MIECERFDRKMTMLFMKSKMLVLVLNNSLLIPSLSITPDKNLMTFGSASPLWFDSKTEIFRNIVVMHISLSDACSSSYSKDPNRATPISLTVSVLQAQGNHRLWRAVDKKEMLTTQGEKKDK